MGKSERIGRRRSGDLEAPAIRGSPELSLLRRGAFTDLFQAAAGSFSANAPKYTSSGGSRIATRYMKPARPQPHLGTIPAHPS